ncbi:MAG: hypothetical protein H6677_15830 [Candidatus Obscuribacterales bacterium]|nr:hypothetical protein [Candidatus Obscuribacterales bacterium]
MKRSIRNLRNNNGSAVSEFGACLAAFFFIAFIPSVNIAAYLAGCYLAEDITGSCADKISKASDKKALSEMVQNMNRRLENGETLAIFKLKAASRPVSVELAVESPEKEHLYDIDNTKTLHLNRTDNLIRYRITTDFVARPFFNLSAVPGIGSVPIIAGPSKITRTIYREIEHPEFLLNTEETLHAQFTKASR